MSTTTDKGTVVLAGLSPFMNGRCRDRIFMSGFPGGHFLADIADEAERRRYIVTTIDQFVKKKLIGHIQPCLYPIWVSV